MSTKPLFVFHVRETEQFLHQLAALAESHTEPEICGHFYAYNSNQGLMQWYDAFSGDPLLGDESMAERKVETFVANSECCTLAGGVSK